MPPPSQPFPGRAPQPQHRPVSKKHHGWIWLVALVAAAIVLFLTVRGGSKPQVVKAPSAIAVSTVKAEKGNIDVTVDALGTVTATYTVTVTSRVSGALTEIHYREGQTVKKGDLLAVIDPRPYDAAVMQQKGQLAKDTATLKNAQIDLARYQNAYAQHAIAQQQVATQQATVDQDQGVIQVDEANLAVAQLNVDYARITAPIDGRVGLRMVDPGNLVAANGSQGLVAITQLQPITVIFSLAEDEIGPIADLLNAGKSLQVQALDRTQEHVLATGQLIALDNQINAATGTVRARASFANEHLELYPNQFVNARVRVRTITGAVLVPNAAIQRNGDQTTVFLVDHSSKALAQPVKIVASQGDESAVTGVEPGETLVADGFDKLQSGTKVVVRGSK
jgi:multidrug efflux system membrane fusion protein